MAMLCLHRVGRDIPHYTWLEGDRPTQLSPGRAGEDGTSSGLPFLHHAGEWSGKTMTEVEGWGKKVRSTWT